MKILRIVLETSNIEKMKKFYTEMLEMPILRSKENFFTTDWPNWGIQKLNRKILTGKMPASRLKIRTAGESSCLFDWAVVVRIN